MVNWKGFVIKRVEETRGNNTKLVLNSCVDYRDGYENYVYCIGDRRISIGDAIEIDLDIMKERASTSEVGLGDYHIVRSFSELSRELNGTKKDVVRYRNASTRNNEDNSDLRSLIKLGEGQLVNLNSQITRLNTDLDDTKVQLGQL